MRFYDITFFALKDDKKDINVYFEKGVIKINSDEYPHARPCITIHTDGDDTQIIKFKNAVISAFETYMRDKKKKNNILDVDFEEMETRASTLLGGDEDDL